MKALPPMTMNAVYRIPTLWSNTKDNRRVSPVMPLVPFPASGIRRDVDQGTGPTDCTPTHMYVPSIIIKLCSNTSGICSLAMIEPGA